MINVGDFRMIIDTQPIKLPLANFTARITAEIRRDDGVDSTREFEIEARLGGQTHRLVVAAAQFASLKWVTEQLGARAVMAAGMGIKDQVREAIQLLSSTQIVERTIYGHSGWRKLEGSWAYLHGGGALGASLAVAGVETSLPAALAPFILPAPPTGAELRSHSRESGGAGPRSRPGDGADPWRGLAEHSRHGGFQRVRLWGDGPVQDRAGGFAPAALWLGLRCASLTRHVGEHGEFQ